MDPTPGQHGEEALPPRLRSPSFHFSAPLLLLIIFHLPLAPLASRQEVAEPMRRRLRFYLHSLPSPGLTLPPRQLSHRRGPPPSGPARACTPAGGQSGAAVLHSRRRAPGLCVQGGGSARAQPQLFPLRLGNVRSASSGGTNEQGAAASGALSVGRFEAPCEFGGAPARTGAAAGSRRFGPYGRSLRRCPLGSSFARAQGQVQEAGPHCVDAPALECP